MKERVRITDVSPRDGLQNEAGIIPTADKVRLIELLCATGVDEIEVTSFVSPKWVPQLGDAEQVIEMIAPLWPRTVTDRGPMCSVLVPNEKGMEAAIRANRLAVALTGRPLIDKVSVFTAASETFSMKNTNATIAETIERFKPVAALASSNSLLVRGYVSCAFGCPFEGPIGPEQVSSVGWLLEPIADELDLGDTIGAATPESIRALLPRTSDYSYSEITLHLHDTFGRAAECVKVALDMGVRSFDGSVAGLGGCPYASKKLPDGTIQRAPGNISTELLVQTIEDAGYETGVDRDALAKAAAFAREIVAKSRAGA